MTPTDLKQWRAERGLTQADLARLLGVDTGTVSRWERTPDPAQHPDDLRKERTIPPYLSLALQTLARRLKRKT